MGFFLTLFWQKKTKILGLSGPLTSHLAYFASLSLIFQYPELLVASYNNNEDAPHEPDGVALVWNMKYKKTTPEYVFHCQVWFCLTMVKVFCWWTRTCTFLSLQHNDFIGLAFTLTTCICKQMLTARDFCLETLFCFRISDIIQNSDLLENWFFVF